MIQSLKRSGRKFNDLWAFIFFVVYFLSGITVLVIYSEHPDFLEIARNLKVNIMIYSSVFMIVQFLVLYFSMLLFPGPFMHFSCIFLPVISVVIALIIGHVISIVLSMFISLIYICIYFFLLKKHIKFAAVILKKTTKNISKNFSLIFAYIVGSTLLFSVLIYCIVTLISALPSSDLVHGGAYFLVFLLIFWIYFNTLYSVRVLISSTVFLEFMAESANQSLEAFTNTLYAAGSVCFGGFIIAVISALQALVDRESNNRQRSGASGIFQIICSIILSLLRDIVDASNRWAFCHLALTGDSFIKSTKESWHILFCSGSNGLVDSYLVEMVLGFFSFIFTLLYAMGLYFFIDDLKMAFNSKERIIAYCFMATSYSFSLVVTYSVFEAGVKAMTFTYALFPDEVRNKDQALADAFDRRKSKL